MAKLKIRWSDEAIAEFKRMLTYYKIRNGNAKYSRSIVKMINESLELATKYPQMFRAVNAREICNVRVFHCDNISIFYRVLETEILVEIVSDTRQDPDKLPY